VDGKDEMSKSAKYFLVFTALAAMGQHFLGDDVVAGWICMTISCGYLTPALIYAFRNE
jgi:hypothetical protein